MNAERVDFVFLACLVLACLIVIAAALVSAEATTRNPFGVLALGVALAALVTLMGLAMKMASKPTTSKPGSRVKKTIV